MCLNCGELALISNKELYAVEIGNHLHRPIQNPEAVVRPVKGVSWEEVKNSSDVYTSSSTTFCNFTELGQ